MQCMEGFKCNHVKNCSSWHMQFFSVLHCFGGGFVGVGVGIEWHGLKRAAKNKMLLLVQTSIVILLLCTVCLLVVSHPK